MVFQKGEVNRGKDVVGDVQMGTDNWNVADAFAKLKILRPLIQLDRYDTIAQFGSEDIGEDFGLTPSQINRNRVEALDRYCSTFIQLLNNVKFALKKDDHEVMDGFMRRVKSLQPYLKKVYSVKNDMVSKEETLEIETELFNKILLILQDIKEKINTPLNNANLIFKATDEMNLDDVMQEIISGG